MQHSARVLTKTDEVQIRSVPEFTVLYQHQLCNCDYVKYYHWENLMEEYTETLHIIFITSSESILRYQITRAGVVAQQVSCHLRHLQFVLEYLGLSPISTSDPTSC